MGCGKKLCCCLAIVLGIVLVLAIILILLAVCIIPGFCLDRSPVTSVSATTQIYSGPDEYTVDCGEGYFYTLKSGQTDGEIIYQVYYDGSDETKQIKFEHDKYMFWGMTSSIVVLQKKDDNAALTNTLAVWNHDNTEIGTFDKGDNEAAYHVGDDWVVTRDTTAEDFYFYAREDDTFTKKSDPITYLNTAEEEKGIRDIDEYNGYVISYSQDKSADPDSFVFTYYYATGGELEASDETLTMSTEVFVTLHWRDRFVGFNNDAHNKEVKAFYARWGTPTEHEWDVTVVPDEGYDLQQGLFVYQKNWIVAQSIGTQTDENPDKYEFRSYDDGALTFTLSNDSTSGLIVHWDMFYSTAYAVVVYKDDAANFTIKKLEFA